MTPPPDTPTQDMPDVPDDRSPDGRNPDDARDTDLALYALDALDDVEARAVETVLAADGDAAAAEARLRRAAGAVAAAADVDLAPPPGLRDRVLAAALAERPAVAAELVPTPPVDLHRIEGERLLDLLRSLPAGAWSAPVDPPEFAGWTVRDIVAHLATVEAYLAQRLGVLAPDAPEHHPVNEDRTAAAIARHRALAPADAVAELEAFLDAVDDHVAALADPAGEPIEWWANPATVADILVVRSFELWVHAADIARAAGRPEPVPAAPSLRTMSTLATALTPIMGAVAGTIAPEATHLWVRFDLTGPGGAGHDVALAIGAAPGGGEPAATLTLDIVDYCRAVAQRTDPSGLAYAVDGDADLAAAVVAALPALATL